MHRVFIVDDESLVIKSLKASIDWKDCGFEVIGEANNGIDALEEILRQKPQLVFTDIRMPGMNGLELIKEVRKRRMDILFVVISGYAEFAYAQKALNYGAMGFCLKPFDETEIISVLARAKNILDKIKISHQAELLAFLEDGTKEGKEIRNSILREAGFEEEGKKGICAAVVIGSTSIELQKDLTYIELKLGRDKTVYFISYVPRGYNDKYGLTCKGSRIKGIGISRVYYSFDDMGRAMNEGFIAAGSYFMTGVPKVDFYNEPSEAGFEEVLLGFKEFIVRGDYKKIEKSLESLDVLLKNGKCTLSHALKLYNIVMYIIYSERGPREANTVSTCSYLLDTFEDIDDMLGLLKDELFADRNSIVEREVKNETFKQIIKYVNKNYTQDISINDIAARFAVNPSYLSQLFRKETNETFTEYITTMRISLAESLLKTTDFAVNEIAEKVGYKDYFYFTRVFKKVTRTTPSKYREKKGMKE